MFFKNLRSSDGVGGGCGVDGALVGVSAEALDMPAMNDDNEGCTAPWTKASRCEV